ncbi:hypothetical protein F3168_14540 [Polymorphobacter fuscus]|uniref:DUF3108 domain-containing protein n=2 Tax=Sandarakinorhabdus fusca TaxID=1439888 RepID=A0A7C9GX72_9SPHN|nr:hypothetical protein [Polymorphobacter fuscus]KAB7644088.1 hypothetical protein F9290_14540 [Polymorphobacter fuscus]MQT18469.1 hypothetical protein [Polymorphobacter fuscus]
MIQTAMTRTTPLQCLVILAFAGAVPAAAAPVALVPEQTESDAYTRYELLAPGSGRFRILYDVTATTPGARFYFNPIRKGSIATDEHVTDSATGKPLRFAVVGADIARAGGLPRAEAGSAYIRVALARPVPPDGEARIRIDKTYTDPKSYFVDGDTITFDRPLGIKRNAIVLPPGYEPVSVNYPSQVLQEADGRIKLSFWNIGPAAAPLVVKARRTPASGATPAALAGRLQERSSQSREIVYYLRDPETHSFDLTHDYTETRPGVGVYTNVVRAGSRVSNPSARDLDTGAALPTETLRGAAIAAAGGDAPGATADTEAVLFRFPAPAPGESRRLRIAETYTDPDRYKLVGDTLVWERAFGRPLNAIVLPAGWTLTNSSVPATISRSADGRVRLDFINPRTDELSVLVTARRR